MASILYLRTSKFYYNFQESQGADQILSSPPASLAQSLDTRRADPDCVMDRTERPSPISVLEPLFMEDDISPASTVCRSG